MLPKKPAKAGGTEWQEKTAMEVLGVLIWLMQPMTDVKELELDVEAPVELTVAVDVDVEK